MVLLKFGNLLNEWYRDDNDDISQIIQFSSDDAHVIICMCAV